MPPLTWYAKSWSHHCIARYETDAEHEAPQEFWTSSRRTPGMEFSNLRCRPGALTVCLMIPAYGSGADPGAFEAWPMTSLSPFPFRGGCSLSVC